MTNFEQYWSDIRAEHESTRDRGEVEWEVVPRGLPISAHGRTWSIDWLRYSSSGDRLIWGWIARPSDHPAIGAALLWLPGYSYGTPPADETSLTPGVVTFCINVHGNQPDAPYVNPAGKNDYITNGIDDPKTFIYRSIVLHCLNALNVLAQQSGIGQGRIAVSGMSQGGALALICAAQSDVPKLCFADMPFLCSIKHAMTVSHSPAYKQVKLYTDTHAEHANDILDTLLLFDPLYHASRIKVPTWLSAGGKDPASRASTIPPVYDALGAPVKEFRLFPDSGHVFVPEMIETYGKWIDTFLD